MSKNSKEQNNIVVYTAVFGKNYDNLKLPLHGADNCDFVCFTDNINLTSDFYDVRYVKKYFDDAARDARMHKILSHKFLPEYQYSVWVDASILIKAKDITQLIDDFLYECDIAVHKHSFRNCVYDEMLECVYRKKDSPRDMLRQVSQYYNDGYPENNGLVETGVLFRHQAVPVVQKINEDWWEQVEKFSKRDQLSFDYVMWRNDAKYHAINDSLFDNDYFEVYAHGIKHDKPICGNQSKLQNEIDMMKTSKFWKLRGKYIQLKNTFKNNEKK